MKRLRSLTSGLPLVASLGFGLLPSFLAGPDLNAQTVAAPTPSAPSLAIAREANQIVLTFQGTLLSSTNLLGPWTEMTDATSPFRLALSTASGLWFRSRQTADGVFTSDTIAPWTLTGPFQAHFELAHAGMPDGIFPPVREKPYIDGHVTFEGLDLPVTLRVRGNSSLQECPFPKLKLKVSSEHRAGTPFASAREIKIGTHCAEGGRGNIGRLRDETATFREALAYEAARVLGFTVPKVRRARIDYRDTTTTDSGGEIGWRIQRQALLLEDAEVLGERLGGRALDDSEIEALRDAHFDEQLIADLRLLHALLGNWDFALSVTGEELWNTDVLELADGTLLPVPGDFDLASWVTGEVLLDAPHDYRPDLPDLERQTAFKLGQIRASVREPVFLTGRTRFEAKRAALEEAVRTGAVDADGRTNALRHITVFFDALGAR